MAFGLNRQLQRTLILLGGAIVFLLGVVKILHYTGTPINTSLYQHLLYSSTSENRPVILDLEFQQCGKMLSSSCEASIKSWKDNQVLDSDIPTMWFKIPKELNLNKNWMTEDYLFKKTIGSKHASANNIPVINQVAMENSAIDSAIPDNANKLPLQILNEFNPLTKLNIDLYLNPKKDLESTEKINIPTLEHVRSAGWKRKNHGLWVKYGPFSASTSVSDINVLFGRDSVDPRPDWELLSLPLTLNIKDLKSMGKLSLEIGSHLNDNEAYLTVKRGINTPINPSVTLSFDRSSRKFKILQVADLHFSTGYGECRDTFPPVEGECLADPKTLKLINSVLEVEKPDLVVLTGDQIFGDASPDAQTTMYKAVAPLIKRKIPFAMTFGNHDDEGSLTRERLMQLVEALPYSLSSAGPENVSGVGNYLLSVSPSNGRKDYSALSLYFLDSHKYVQEPKMKGYDYLKQDQLEYVMSLSEDLRAKNEAVQGRINKKTSPYGALAMAFFHIPLPEYRDIDVDPQTGKQRKIIGSLKEGVTAPIHNSGMKQVLAKVGVSVVSVGHDHCNDYCVRNDIWLCYGGAAGEGGYAGYGGTARRVRIYEINEELGRINTWKRLETDPFMIDEDIILVNEGKVISSQ